jgi:3-hydroxyacyl-CoA dehydrogenase
MTKVHGMKGMDPVKMRKIINIAVIGEGRMGSSIFLYLNGFDFNLIWLCSGKTGMENARKTFIRKAGHLYNSGIISESEYALKLTSTKITSDASDLVNCDLIIEAITESLPDKRELFKMIGSIVNKDCILTSNSSSLLPSDIIATDGRKEKFAGLHFFFPVALKNNVELIAGPSTSAETRESLYNFLLTINKRPFCQDESTPFILNRSILDLQAEAFHIISEKEISIEGLDELVKQYILPSGVFEFFDHVGIDIMLSSIESYMRFQSDKDFYLPMIQRLQSMVKNNYLGIKTGSGFYDYKGLRKKTEHSGQTAQLPGDTRQKTLIRLWHYYERSFLSILDSGVCSREELAVFLQDYLGIDRDPLTLKDL